MKQLTFDDRLQIQKGLTLNKSYSQIAKDLGKNRTSVSREVQAHLQEKGKPARSKCIHHKECIFEDKSLCPVPNCTKRACSVACSKCADYCDRYEPIICPRLLHPPYSGIVQTYNHTNNEANKSLLGAEIHWKHCIPIGRIIDTSTIFLADS